MPSKKFLTVIVLVIIALLILTIFNIRVLPKRDTRIASTNEQKEGLIEGSARSLLAKEAPLVDTAYEDQIINDADGDGLLDWEELLWGTNPLKADTDGNGISDGDEVALIQERHRADIENLASVDAFNQNLSRTDVIARDSYTALTTLDTIKELQGEDYELLTNSTIEQIESSLPIKLTKVTELHTVSNSDDNLRSYLLAMDSIFEDYSLTPEDVDNINGYVSEGHQTGQYMSAASESVATQKLMASEMTRLSVPLVAVDQHLNLINRLNAFVAVGELLLNDTPEPVLSYAALFKYQDFTAKLIDAYSKFLNLTNELTNQA